MRQRNTTRAVVRRGTAAFVATLALVAGLLAGAPSAAVATASAPQRSGAAEAKTLTGSSWRAGDIISDALFYDPGALTASEIQTFLNAKIGSCTNGRCLNVIKVAPANQPAYVSDNTGATVCKAVTGGTMSVATWIYRVQVACGLSAKVILATLQKEQGLVTKTAPSTYALTYAMGMNCPDTTGCSSTAGGLASQIYRGSRQLVIYKKSRFGKQPGVQPILYSPNSCGSSSVNVANYATAALYNYTPYQPNSAALANLTGIGNSCSSYGNRNFWYYYSTWFGSTHGAAFGWMDSGSGMLAVDANGDLYLYGGNGKTGWKARTLLGSGFGAYTHVVGVGDVSGDGHRDVVAVDAAGALKLFASDGLSTLAAPVTMATGWGAFTDVLGPGDLDGDGRADILTRDAAGALTLHPSDGLGGFRPDVALGTGWNAYDALVAPGDFNGDGKADLIARDTAGKLYLFRGTGSAAFAPRLEIGHGWATLTAIIGVADFTGDKKPDLMGRQSTGTLKIYPGNGSGGFLSSKIGSPGFAPFTLSGLGPLPTPAVVVRTGAGDLKLDGHRDVLAREASGALWVYPGTGVKFATRIRVTGDFSGMTAIVGADDFDRNGSTDVIMRDAAGILWLYPSNKVGGFSTRKQIATGWAGYTAVLAPGDMNGDRIPDLIGRDAAGNMQFFAGDGAGGLRAATQIGTGWGSLRIITPGDFDLQGAGDLIAIDSSGNLRFYGGTGTGGLRSGVQIAPGWGPMTAVWSPGDFDGDGIPDLLGRDVTGKLWLYRGSGSGTLQPRVLVGTGWQIFNWIG
ncbi:MAG: repeat protein [Schumannella sp.]|nr:repeat protein [Schumannella sp.]